MLGGACEARLWCGAHRKEVIMEEFFKCGTLGGVCIEHPSDEVGGSGCDLYAILLIVLEEGVDAPWPCQELERPFRG